VWRLEGHDVSSPRTELTRNSDKSEERAIHIKLSLCFLQSSSGTGFNDDLDLGSFFQLSFVTLRVDTSLGRSFALVAQWRISAYLATTTLASRLCTGFGLRIIFLPCGIWEKISPINLKSRTWMLPVDILQALWRKDEAQDIAEYAVMLAVILVIIIGTIRLIGSNSNNVFSSVSSSLQ
jgi:Flp pilus assembly pilin Flp